MQAYTAATAAKQNLLRLCSAAALLACLASVTLKTHERRREMSNLLGLMGLSTVWHETTAVSLEDKIPVIASDYTHTIILSPKSPAVAMPASSAPAEEPVNLDLPDDIFEQIPFELPHEDGEATHPVTEQKFGLCGMKFENFYVNNKTGMDLDIAQVLSQRPDVHIKKNSSPQVLIVHTHTCEGYIDKDEGFFYESFYPRSQDPRYSVVRVGKAIAWELENAGIGVVHDITCHDSPTFNGSYGRSAETIDKNLEKHPSIQVVLDIHRDTITRADGTRIKPTFTINGHKAAQIMVLSGCDTDGSLNFPSWQENLRFALRLHQRAEKMYNGMTRALSFGKFKYNMHKTPASLLIEVGSELNTLNEAVLSGRLLGKALASLLEELP